ncbi:MAG: hypothetical protein IV100_32170 [Myxococcales bacterium]|nr:hypothetical protein [Myxococcales bacterium]
MSDTCTLSSLTANEPLAATAVENVATWLLIEQDGGWGKKGLDDAPIDDDVRAHLLAAVAKANAAAPRSAQVRPQLVRQEQNAGTASSEAVRILVARAGAPTERLTLSGLRAALDLDIAAWLQGQAPSSVELDPRPLVLVCTHGKRDRCCAEHGLAFYRELAARWPTGGAVTPDLWQSTHLGGHRFAATAVALPDGYQYGRLSPADALAFADAIEAGRLYDLATLRGRSTLSAPAQAADLHLRQSLGLHGPDDVSLTAMARGDGNDCWNVTLGAASASHALTVERRWGPKSIMNSCGAPELSVSVEWVTSSSNAAE